MQQQREARQRLGRRGVAQDEQQVPQVAQQQRLEQQEEHVPLQRRPQDQQRHQPQTETESQPGPLQPMQLVRRSSPHAAGETEREPHTMSQKEEPLSMTAAERRRIHAHAAFAQQAATPASVHPQPSHPLYAATVNREVPFVSYPTSGSVQKQQLPAGSLLQSPVSAALTSSSLDVPAPRERSAHFRIEEGSTGRGNKEDESGYSHSTRGSSGNSNCRRVEGAWGGVRGKEGGYSAAAVTTDSTRSDIADLHAAECGVHLHRPEDACGDTAVQSSSLAGRLRGPGVRAVATPVCNWESRLGDVADGEAGDPAGLPRLSSPFYSNVFSSGSISDSAGSSTSPAASPAAASSPYSESAPLTTPVSGLSALGSHPSPASCAAVSAGTCRTTLSTALHGSSAPGTPRTQEHHEAAEKATSVFSPCFLLYDETRPQTRADASSQRQARTQPERNAEKKPHSSSTGDSDGSRHNSDSRGGLVFNVHSPRQSCFSSPVRGSSAVVASPSAGAAFSASGSSSSSPAADSPSASCASPTTGYSTVFLSDGASRMEAVSSPAVAPVGTDRRSSRTTGVRRSSWGRQLNAPGKKVEIVADKSVYRQEKVKRPEQQRPVLLPNGEPLPGVQLVYDPATNELQNTSLSPCAALDWKGPMALPYNSEEVPPSPFSKGTGSPCSSRSCSSAWPEGAGLPHLSQRRASPLAALAAMRIPRRFWPPHHSSAEGTRSAFNATLNHADFSPPSPFVPSTFHSPSQDTRGGAAQQVLPYPEVAVRTCAVHQQMHTFVYPFAVARTATESAAASSSSISRPQSAAAEPQQQPVPTYCISNNGMGEAVSYSGRGAAANKKTASSPWLRWLGPWRKQHAVSATAAQQRQQQHRGGSYETQQALASSLQISHVVTSAPSLSSPGTPAGGPASPHFMPSQGGGTEDSSRRRRAFGKLFLPSLEKRAAAAADCRHAPARHLSSPHGSTSTLSCEAAGEWRDRGRGTFVLAAVSAALEIGCVWRFPSYCFKFGGATFLLAYVVLLLVLGVPVLALEMALGQVFRGGLMKVLNLISPRLRGLAAATLLLSFFICAYYSIFVSWTLQFLFSSIRPSLPWSTTPQEAAICAAAGYDAAACSRATLPTPLFAAHGIPQRWQPMEEYVVKREEEEEAQPRGKQKQLQQALRRLRALQVERKGVKQKEEVQQSFCAWQKPVGDDNSGGVCVADDKLKARTFLYTDVVGLWVKTTEHVSSVPGVFFLAAGHGEEEFFRAIPSTGRAETSSSAAGTATVDASLTDGSVAAAAAAHAVAAGSESSSPPEFSSGGVSWRRLAPSSAVGDNSLSTGTSPRVTSVAVAASLWNITPLVAVGLAAVWMQIYLFSLRGYKPTTTFTCVTAVMPIMAMLLIAGLALSLDGASLGLRHLVSASPQAFSSPFTPTHVSVRAPARKVHASRIADTTSVSAVSPAGALSHRIPAAAAPAHGVAGQRGYAPVSADAQATGCSGPGSALSAAAAPAPARLLATTAPVASQRVVAAASPTEAPRSSSTNSTSGGGFLSFLSPFWPRWMAPGSRTLWGEAAAQVFFSLGVFQGVVTAYASHKHLTENVLLDAAAAAVTNLGMSLLAAVATFAVAGHVAKRLGAVDSDRRAADLSALHDVQGSQLVFVLYPLAFASLPTIVAQVTCILCFLALLLLGLTSLVGLVQPVLGLLRRCLWLQRCPRWKIAGAVCSTGLLVGLPFCTRGGLLLVEAADYRWTVVGLVFVGCCESIAFGWLYGVGRQAHCIGYLPLLLHGVTYWLAVLLAAVILFLLPPPYNAPTTALAVSVSVAAAGAAAALWCCPWKVRCRERRQIPAKQQSQRDGKETKGQEEHDAQEQQTQQQPVKRKGKPQSGTLERSRVTFTNGYAGSTSNAAATSSSSSRQENSSCSNGNDFEGGHHIPSCSTDSDNTQVSGNTCHTSTSGAAVLISGSTFHRGSHGNDSNSNDSSTGDNTGGHERGVTSGSNDVDGGSAQRSVSAEGSSGTNSGPPGRLRHSAGTLSGNSSTSSKADVAAGSPRPAELGTCVRSGASCGDGALEGLDDSNVGHNGDVPGSGSSGDSLVASRGGSSGSDKKGMRGRQDDPVVVLDTPNLYAAGKSPKQQQKRYRSPRSRDTRRRRGGRNSVLIKRDGEALPFQSCVFWLFVGNVEHLRKNLNAITCSGYRVLRLWPPWSIAIRYIIPTILVLLAVQELPQLFVTVSRYSQPPPPTGAVSSRNAAAIAQLGVQPDLQQHSAVQQQDTLLRPLSFGEEQQQQQQHPRQRSQQQLNEGGPRYRSALPAAAGAAWQSLVAIHVFTLGALLLVVGFVVLGLLLPQVWDEFIPKERRRHGLDTTAAAASSFRSVSSRGSSSRLAAPTETAGAVPAP